MKEPEEFIDAEVIGVLPGGERHKEGLRAFQSAVILYKSTFGFFKKDRTSDGMRGKLPVKINIKQAHEIMRTETFLFEKGKNFRRIPIFS